MAYEFSGAPASTLQRFKGSLFIYSISIFDFHARARVRANDIKKRGHRRALAQLHAADDKQLGELVHQHNQERDGQPME